MSRSHIQVLIACAVLSVGASGIRAVEFAGGTGTYSDPYQIATAEQLSSIGYYSALRDKCFVLTNDIDMRGHPYAVIGPFSGVFDGNGFSIRNLTIHGGRGQGSGMFERIEVVGEVRRLILDEVLMLMDSGPNLIGAIAGFNSGVISRCSVSGTMVTDGSAAGIVGANYGLIEECRSLCTISASEAGGLVCTDKGQIRDSYAAGHLMGESAYGLAVHSTLEIRRCYAVCRIDASGCLNGGFVGRDSPMVLARGTGYFLTPSEGGGRDTGIGTPLTSIQMRQQASFVGWDFEGTDTDGSRDVWFMPEGGFPELGWLEKKPIPNVAGLPAREARNRLTEAGFATSGIAYDYDRAVDYGCAITTHPFPEARPGVPIGIVVSLGPHDWSCNPGVGDAEHPYMILTGGQLDCLAYRPDLWGKCFRLAGDLDMVGRVYGEALIGRSGVSGVAFNGVFDGDGHIIRNLTFGGYPSEDRKPTALGLFGETGPEAHITNLGLANVSIRAARHMRGAGGMLCAVNTGCIERCYGIGQLCMSGRLGGLVGSNIGLIENCYTQGEIEAVPRDDAGGLYAGLAAYNASGTIRTCYSTCAVPPAVGAGLVGANEAGLVEYSLWDVEASGVRTSLGGGTGLNTNDLRDMYVLSRNGWAENPDWIVDQGEDYPRLVWEGTDGRSIPAMPSRVAR